MRELCKGVFCGDAELEPGVFHDLVDSLLFPTKAWRPDDLEDGGQSPVTSGLPVT